MPARGIITLDGSQYEKKLDELKSKTGKSTDDMSKSVSRFGSDVGKVGGVIGSFASTVGSKFGLAGKAISAIASGPVAALTAALGALVAIGVDMWDKLTLSAEEYRAKLESAVEIESKRLSKMEQAKTEEDGYLARLNELTKQEYLSNAEKEEAAFLIQTLSSRYSTFSASIDEATGKIVGLTEAEQELNRVRKEQTMRSLENQIKNKSLISERDAEDLLKGGLTQQFADTFTFGGDNAGRRRVRNYQSMTTEQKLAFAQDMIRPGGRATTDSEIRGWSKIAQSLQEQIDLENQLNNLKEIGTKTEKERATALQTASDIERKSLDEEESAWKAFNEARIKGEEEWEKKAEEAAEKELENERRKAEKKKQYFDNSLASLRDAALRASGRNRQADIEAAVRAAEQANGGEKLDAADYKRTVAIANARYDLAHMPTGAQALDYAPRVNSLVARGGSSAPVKMPKIEELQSKSLRAQETISKTAAAILKKVDAWGTI